MDYDRNQLLEGFAYLDRLRASGITNMFGAPAYMERELGYEKTEAVNVWGKWCDTFSEDSVEDRVNKVMEEA